MGIYWLLSNFLSLDLLQKYGALNIIMPRAFEVPLDIVMNKTWDKKLIYEFVYDS
jgi:hypothetical protein